MTEKGYTELMQGLQKLRPDQAVKLIWELSLNEPGRAHRLLYPNSLREGALDAYWSGKPCGTGLGHKIKAIKWYRSETGLGLKESKDLVEEILDSEGIDHSPRNY